MHGDGLSFKTLYGGTCTTDAHNEGSYTFVPIFNVQLRLLIIVDGLCISMVVFTKYTLFLSVLSSLFVNPYVGDTWGVVGTVSC